MNFKTNPIGLLFIELIKLKLKLPVCTCRLGNNIYGWSTWCLHSCITMCIRPTLAKKLGYPIMVYPYHQSRNVLSSSTLPKLIPSSWLVLIFVLSLSEFFLFVFFHFHLLALYPLRFRTFLSHFPPGGTTLFNVTLCKALKTPLFSSPVTQRPHIFYISHP